MVTGLTLADMYLCFCPLDYVLYYCLHVCVMYMCVECIYLSEKHIISKSVTMFIAQPFLVLIQRNTIKQVVVVMMMTMMMISTETILMTTTADLVTPLTAGGVVTGDGLTSAVGNKTSNTPHCVGRQNIKHPSLRRQTKYQTPSLRRQTKYQTPSLRRQTKLATVHVIWYVGADLEIEH